MIKSLVLFLRKKAIKKSLQRKRVPIMPELNKYPVVSILIDENQKHLLKDIENAMKTLFNPKRYRFIILNDVLPDNYLLSDTILFLTKDDFNFWGVLRNDKMILLKSFVDDLFVNLTDSQDDMLNDYIVSMINSNFKVGGVKNNPDLYDFIFNYGIEKNNVERLKIIKKYLLMLSGSKDEK